jgi:hypothetical protein
MPRSAECRGEVVERAACWKALVTPPAGGTTFPDQMIADRDQLIDAEHRSELTPHVGGTRDREPLDEHRIAGEARQAMADDPGNPGRSVRRSDADMHLVPAQPRRERSIQEMRGRQVREELRRCHSLGVRATQLQVREMTLFGRQVRARRGAVKLRTPGNGAGIRVVRRRSGDTPCSSAERTENAWWSGRSVDVMLRSSRDRSVRDRRTLLSSTCCRDLQSVEHSRRRFVRPNLGERRTRVRTGGGSAGRRARLAGPRGPGCRRCRRTSP